MVILGAFSREVSPHNVSSAAHKERERRGRQFSLSADSFLWEKTKAERKHYYQRCLVHLVQQTPSSFSFGSHSLLQEKRVLTRQKWASCAHPSPALPTTPTPPSLYSRGSRIYLGFILHMGVLAFHPKPPTIDFFFPKHGVFWASSKSFLCTMTSLHSYIPGTA